MYFLKQLKTQFFFQIYSFQESVEKPGGYESAEVSEKTEPVLPPEKRLESLWNDAALNAKTSLKNWEEIEARRRALEAAEAGQQNPTLNANQEAVLKWLETGSVSISGPEVRDVAKSLGMESVIETAWVDAMLPGEKDDIGTPSNPEQIAGSIKEIEAEKTNLTSDLAKLTVGTDAHTAMKKRIGLLDGFSQMLQGNAIEWGGSAIANAQKYVWVKEWTAEAEKFLLGQAQNTRNTPWCAGFVSCVLQESGYTGKPLPTLSSQAFIGGSGKGHVAFYVWNNQMLGGNQGNEVSVENINKAPIGWVMPEDLWNPEKVHKSQNWEPIDVKSIPIGAVIVFNRGGNETDRR